MTGWDTRAGLRAPRAISTNINPTHGVAGHYGGAGPFKRSDHDACRAIWRSWQDFHMSSANANNYNDIAYNLGVCHHDIVLEGRSTRTRPIVRGGANGNFTVNGNRYSVVAIWGANDGAWPDGLRRAWRHARDWLRKQDSRTGTGLDPHSALSSTGCPGKYGRAFLAAGAPYPSGSTPQSTGDDMPYKDWPTEDRAAMLRDIRQELDGSDSWNHKVLVENRDLLRAMAPRVRSILSHVGTAEDAAAIAAELAPLVIPPIVAALSDEDGATPQQVEERVSAALRDFFAPLGS